MDVIRGPLLGCAVIDTLKLVTRLDSVNSMEKATVYSYPSLRSLLKGNIQSSFNQKPDLPHLTLHAEYQSHCSLRR